MRDNTALAFVAGLTIPLSALAGQIGIKITVAGQEPTTTFRQVTNGQDIEIDLQTLTAATDVHVFDVLTNDSEDSLGMVTLRGDNADNYIVRVAIAAVSLNSVGDAFDDQGTSLVFGLKNLGGFQVLPSTIGGASPRDRTAVNISVSGDITGPVTAGRLFRVQASRLQGASTGGTISGDLRATSPDGTSLFPTLDFPAIGQIWAGWQITGDIIADGGTFDVSNRDTWGSVDRIVVNPPPASAPQPTLGGSILCEKGVIGDIVTTGPIGMAAQPVAIRAGMRVGRITIRSEGTTSAGSVLDADIYADVDASFQSEFFQQFEGTAIDLLETNGDFNGDIHLSDFYGQHDYPNSAQTNVRPTGGGPRRGFFVGGHFNGNITVDYNWEYGDMIARSFNTITIGQMLKGAIVAVGDHGTTNGRIESISVGFGDLSNPPLREGGYANLPGFSGIQYQDAQILLPPFDASEAARQRWYTEAARDYFTIDGLIRATDSIGSVELRAMSNQLPVSGSKTGKPRVEAHEIGQLRIGAFDTGAVWSGHLEVDAQGVLSDDLSNDYASIGNVSLGCVGPMADLWVTGAGVITVDGDMFGEIRLPFLSAEQLVHIGGRLGDRDHAAVIAPGTGCLDVTGGSPAPFIGSLSFTTSGANSPDEDSPRGTWGTLGSEVEPGGHPIFIGTAEYSRIVLEDPSSLNGQIIIDATNTTGVHRTDAWLGDVVIGTGTPDAPLDEVIISTNSGRATYPGGDAPDAIAPLYNIPSHILGGQTPPARGGAVGLVPFARYEADCNPENYRSFELEGADPLTAPFLDEGAFIAGAASAQVAYYGPVFSAGKGLELNRVSLVNAAISGAVLSSMYTTDAADGNRVEPRVVAVKGVNQPLPGGRFALLPRGSVSANDDLLCDLGPGITPPLTFEPADSTSRFARYDFLLSDGCNVHSECPACFDAMGSPLNLLCFIADVDGSGGADGDDVIAFFALWDVGADDADVNFDGGVDGDDIVVFFCWWDHGGCDIQ